MAAREIRGKRRSRALGATLALLFCGLAGPAQAETAQPERKGLRALAPPENALRLTPGPDGRVLMQLDVAALKPELPVALTLRTFWDRDGTPYDFALEDPDAEAEAKTATTKVGRPIRLKAEGIPEGRVVWGILEAEQEKITHRLPLALGAFGPAVEGAPAVTVSAEGAARLTLDVGRHRAFGETARFELTPFTAAGHEAEVRFATATPEPGETTRDVALPEGRQRITLELDAASLRAETAYSGALRTVIGERRFIETELVLTRQKWPPGPSFRPIPDSKGRLPLGLTLGAVGDQPVHGFWVESVTAATEDIAPQEHLAITLDGESLTEFDPTRPEDLGRRILEPGVRKNILVEARTDLPAGSHEVTLKIAALNVDPSRWEEVKTTLVVPRHWFWPVFWLVLAVFASYGTTKWLAAMIQRRNLRARITEIQKQSWLRSDRWGALPVVRAFGRAKMADKALSHRFGEGLSSWPKRLSRFITTPKLIADEVKEVEDRMEVLKRLNELAIYWKAAPSATGVTVSGVDDRIVKRAQKALRGIVDRLGQLQEREAVDDAILADIAALEAWEDRQKLEAGYWASLRVDMQLLLDSVDLDRFDFDDAPRQRLAAGLRAALEAAPDDSAISAALDAAEAVAEKGVGPLRERLTPLPAGIADAKATESDLQALEDSDREVVRRLRAGLDPGTAPGTLNGMIRMEQSYIWLKLIWEQRGDDQRRRNLVDQVRQDRPLEEALKEFDEEVWTRLKVPGVIKVVPPDAQRRVEEFQPIDFKVECADPLADTYLFKHGLEYEWTIDWGGERLLKLITRSTVVTQFIPKRDVEVKVGVLVRRGRDSLRIGLPPEEPEAETGAEAPGEAAEPLAWAARFKTHQTSAFDHLWPTPTPELIGIAIALALALLTGLQSNVFAAALVGSWKEDLALIAWGVGADQTKNLLANLDSLTKGKGPAGT
ncbi:MAG: hypothetical protein QNJ30_19445 [Kiloniellales bacterium]|nr:hypothetical protein [Kiloniellales bacterium]